MEIDEILTGGRDIVEVEDKDSRLAIRTNIEDFAQAMRAMTGSENGEADEINAKGLKEYFVGGAYIRELFIPKDTAIVSQLWKRDRFWIIATGDVTIASELGRQRVKGPYSQIAPFGSKIALYTHEDTLWYAICGAESKTSDEVEKEVIAKDYEEIRYPWDKLIEG